MSSKLCFSYCMECKFKFKKNDITKHYRTNFFFSKFLFSFGMEYKFNYLQGKLLVYQYLSKQTYLHSSIKLDKKHFYIIIFLKKISSKLFFGCMECKFELKIIFFCKFHNFLDIRQLRLMTFAIVLWMRQLKYKLIYRYEI